jgi:hypothetical protein
MRPDSRFQEPNMSFDDGNYLNDSFYQALPPDKKEAYKDARLEDVAKDIDETAAKAIEDAENNDFYQTQLDAATQASTKEKATLIEIEQKLKDMRAGDIKGLGTKDIKTLKALRYPQNKVYEKAYTEGLSKQENLMNQRISELNDIIATKTGKQLERAEKEKIQEIMNYKKL